MAPQPDILCFDPAYESVEVVLTCGVCYDGIDIVVPAGQFISRVSQADADAQALAWGEEQLSCLPADPASIIPSWDDLSGDVAIMPIDVYGLKGFEAYAVADLESAGRLWCTFEPALDFCDGPEIESQPLEYGYERYSDRWKAQNDAGVFSYAKVGEEWSPAPVGLFPTTVSGAEGVSISFDANARPCFAFGIGGNVELRRFVAGVPTTYSWSGSSPKLFFDGLLQIDVSLRDVVCFYLSGGNLCVRMQRDNFGIEHVLAEALGVVELVKADRGIGAEQNRLFLSALTQADEKLLLRSAPYPPWPVLAGDAMVAGVTCIEGIHRCVVVATGPYEDSAANEIGPLTGIHRAVVVTLQTESDSAASSIGVVTGAHKLVRVTLATESDLLTSTIGPLSGVHKFVVIQAGTYNDSAASTTAPLTGVHRHV